MLRQIVQTKVILIRHLGNLLRQRLNPVSINMSMQALNSIEDSSVIERMSE